ncbi:MAG: hypothetical protein ACREQA_20685 [Candidatus Binatia bacterium]
MIKQTIALHIIDCCLCGGSIAFTDAQYQSLVKTHGTFYCSMGHGQCFGEGDEAEKLKKQLTQAQDRVARLELQNGNLAAMVDAANKKTRRTVSRADKGVCQHCHRHFVNVRRHVESKHVAAT